MFARLVAPPADFSAERAEPVSASSRGDDASDMVVEHASVSTRMSCVRLLRAVSKSGRGRLQAAWARSAGRRLGLAFR